MKGTIFALLSTLGFASSQTLTCPLTSQQVYSTLPADVAAYRGPVYKNKVLGTNVIMGFKEPYLGCETCGYTSSSSSEAELYGYNYAWNAETGLRTFWEDPKKGFNTKPAWYQSCPGNYARSSYTSMSPSCIIPSNVKFLSESCKSKSDCQNHFTKAYVSMTCAPTNNDAADPQPKCVLGEEVASTDKICTCFGLLYCDSSDCYNSQCVLSSFDGNKHCRYSDEGLFTQLTNGLIGERYCTSNCRALEPTKQCKVYGGGDPMKTDSSKVAVASGCLGIGFAGVIGVGMFVRKRNLKKLTQGKMDWMEMSNNGRV